MMKRAVVLIGVLLGCLPGVVLALGSGSGHAPRSVASAAYPPNTPTSGGSGASPSAAFSPAGAGSRAAATAGLTPDPEAARSYPETASTPRPSAPATPARVAAATRVAAGAPSDAQVRQELRQMHAVVHAQRAVGARSAPQGGVSVAGQGMAVAPPGAPLAVARVVAAGNQIADFPYVWGGGHASFLDTGYDCSGSVSYALAAAGLVSRPLVSGELTRWGVPGPGRWISVYATAGHTYMYVGGLRFDTSGRSGPLGSRWQASQRDNSGFVVRHWPGL